MKKKTSIYCCSPLSQSLFASHIQQISTFVFRIGWLHFVVTAAIGISQSSHTSRIALNSNNTSETETDDENKQKKFCISCPTRYWWEPSNSVWKTFTRFLHTTRGWFSTNGRLWLIWPTAASHMLDWAPVDYKALDFLFFGIFSIERKQYFEIIFGLPSVYAFCAQLNTIEVATESTLAAPNQFSYRKHCVCVCEKFVTKVQIPHHLQLLAFIAKCLFQFLVFACFFSRRWRDDIYGFVAIRKLINFYLLTVWHVCDVFVSCAVHIIPQSIQSIEVHWSGTSRWEKRPHGNGSTQVVWLCLGARCDITTSV